MRPRLLHLLAALAALLLAACTPGGSGTTAVKPPPETLQRGSLVAEARAPSEADVYYIPPRFDERLALQNILPRFFADLRAGEVEADEYRDAFEKAGFRLHQLRRGDDRWLVLSEGGESWRGTGVYVFRLGADVAEMIVQAPHSYFDLRTGEVAERVFESMEVRGLFFNTLHRYRPFPEASKKAAVDPSDLAHSTDSYFHMLSVEYLSAVPDGMLVQLHGYAHDSLEERGIGVVLSDGTDSPSATVRALRARFGDQFAGHRVALYPEETRLYGATSNAQANWVNTFGRGRFIHVELSPELRSQLATDDQWLHDLVEVLQPSQK